MTLKNAKLMSRGHGKPQKDNCLLSLQDIAHYSFLHIIPAGVNKFSQSPLALRGTTRSAAVSSVLPSGYAATLNSGNHSV